MTRFSDQPGTELGYNAPPAEGFAMAEPAARRDQERVSVIMHDGKHVILVDTSGLSAQEMTTELPAIQKVITSQAAGSALVLTDWTGAEITKAVLTAIKRVAVMDRAHVKRIAIVAPA